MKSDSPLPIIGMNIAKNVFQLHIVDVETGEIQRRQLKRAEVAEFFSNHQQSLVGIEACGGAHHWARTLLAMGHQVKLLPAKHVRAFVLRDKTDALDAQAIWVAAQQPHIREVPVKSEQQQACLSLHRIRAQLMKMRIMQTNALRGLIYEFCIVLPEGHKRLLLAVQAIPGIGPLTATALVATAADLSTLKSGRQFAAWLGLTPRQVGTGGKTQQLGISKRDDSYLRTLLISGARSVVCRSTHSSWRTADAATASQRGSCRAGQQNGTHRLGCPGQRTSL